jgi:EAL domain-containing protein (putative c-di-GMP-specific phosphodiesterase class I)
MDRSFVRDIQGDGSDAVLVRAIIGLARTLGKAVVAEGVETEAQRDFLRREGCDELQGWLFARDLPADEVPALVQRLSA